VSDTVGYLCIDNHLTDVYPVIVIPVQSTDMAQVVASDIGVLLIGLSLHALPNTVGYGLCRKALVDAAEGLDSVMTDGLSRLPLRECRRIGGDGVVIVFAARYEHTCAADEGSGQYPLHDSFH
jgi:hypothetical protein